MNKCIKIGNRYIGPDYPPVVIAEIGINHEGSLETAFEMVDSAFRAGAEIIKHQTHVIDDEMSSLAKKVIPGNTNVSIYDVMKRCALSEADEKKLKEYIESKGMIFLSTPFSREAARRLESFGVSAYKIGSGECNNYPLIEYICTFKKPIILSTGMNNIDSVRKSVEIIERHGIPYALLHCTNVYPTPPNLVRLGGMTELLKQFPNSIVGLSDHTMNNNSCLAATALGACILERHFTDRKNRTGPDIICSMDEKELSELIKGTKEIKMMLGGTKEPIIEEKATINFAFATVVAITDIEPGEEFSVDNIWVKRPGTGEIKAESFDSILGKKATRFVARDEHLKWKDIM